MFTLIRTKIGIQDVMEVKENLLKIYERES